MRLQSEKKRNLRKVLIIDYTNSFHRSIFETLFLIWQFFALDFGLKKLYLPFGKRKLTRIIIKKVNLRYQKVIILDERVAKHLPDITPYKIVHLKKKIDIKNNYDNILWTLLGSHYISKETKKKLSELTGQDFLNLL